MHTGTSGFIGAALLLLIDLVWSFSGPMGWGNNGECGVGNAQLQMIATIVRKRNGTTSEWSIPESAMVTCGNVSGSTDQFKISVKWIWEMGSLTSSPTVPSSAKSTKSPEASKSTKKPVPTANPSTTPAPTLADAAPPPTTPKAKEKRDSDNLFLGKELEFLIDSETSTTGTFSTETTTVTTQVSSRTDVPGGTSTTSGTTTDSPPTITAESTSTADVTSTDVSSSTAESSTSRTDSTTEVRAPGVKFLSEEIFKQSTVLDEVTEATAPYEIVRRSGSFRSNGMFGRFQEPPEIIRSCYPYCDSDEDTALLRFGETHQNRLTFTVTKSHSLFHVSNINIYYELPDEKNNVYRIYWQNVKLFPGPMGTTHVCENATKLQLNYDAELVLQGTKLAAFLPQNDCEFPKKEADCSCKYEDEEDIKFCKTAEIIMITVGAVLGVLLLSGLAFYIAKLYCKSKREREARDTIP